LKVLNQGDFAKRAIELEMTIEEWNLWQVKSFDVLARVDTTYGKAYYLLVAGNPVIVQVRPKDQNLHVWETPRTQREPLKQEEMLA
jgi:hypothetical protein